MIEYKSYDVLVLGAGPAGSSAAYHAARRGARVLLVDRTAFPRPKICGDALTPRALAAITRMDSTDLPGWRVHGIRFRTTVGDSFDESFEDHSSAGTGLVVARAELDERLWNAAIASGADFRVGTVLGLSRDFTGRVVGASILSAGKRIDVSARTVILAIGAAARKFLRGDPPSSAMLLGLAARCYVSVEHSFGEQLIVRLGAAQSAGTAGGYAWIFPVSDEVANIGVGIVRSNRSVAPNPRRMLRSFLDEALSEGWLGSPPAIQGSIESAPLVAYAKTPVAPGLLPVGDAAGVMNALTGEGIAQAIESGELAALAVVDAPSEPESCYSRSLDEMFPCRAELVATARSGAQQSRLWTEAAARVLACTTRPAGAQVRNAVWRLGWYSDWWEALPPRHAKQIRRVAATLTGEIVAMLPMLGTIATRLVHDPAWGFGIATALIAATRPESNAETDRVARILERANLLVAAHEDLAVVAGAPSHESWGADLMAVALADTLNAQTLAEIYLLDSSLARDLSQLIAETLESLRRRSPIARDNASAYQAARYRLFHDGLLIASTTPDDSVNERFLAPLTPNVLQEGPSDSRRDAESFGAVLSARRGQNLRLADWLANSAFGSCSTAEPEAR